MPGVLEGAVLRVSGEVVRGNAPEFKQQLTELLTQVEPALQVDLAGVDTLDTSGLQVLLAARTSALLKHLDGRTRNVPVVLLYPGERRGDTGLSFMGIINPDSDYRPRIYP